MANKKTSDYGTLPGGVPNDAWLLDIANPGVVNYKGTSLEFKDYVNAGRTGGKTIYGGLAPGDNLILDSTEDATKGIIQSLSDIDIQTNKILFGNGTDTAFTFLEYDNASTTNPTLKLNPTIAGFANSNGLHWEVQQSNEGAGFHIESHTASANTYLTTRADVYSVNRFMGRLSTGDFASGTRKGWFEQYDGTNQDYNIQAYDNGSLKNRFKLNFNTSRAYVDAIRELTTGVGVTIENFKFEDNEIQNTNDTTIDILNAASDSKLRLTNSDSAKDLFVGINVASPVSPLHVVSNNTDTNIVATFRSIVDVTGSLFTFIDNYANCSTTSQDNFGFRKRYYIQNDAGNDELAYVQQIELTDVSVGFEKSKVTFRVNSDSVIYDALILEGLGAGSVSVSVSDTFLTDTINEYNTNSGVTIETILMKDKEIGASGDLVTKGWFADMQIDNININGNTLNSTSGNTTISSSTGNVIIGATNGGIEIGAGFSNVDLTASQRFNIGATTSQMTGYPYGKYRIVGDSASTDYPSLHFFLDPDFTYPVSTIANHGHDDCSYNFDAYYDGSNWKSSDAGSNAQIYKNADKLEIRYDSGVAQGSNITWNTGWSMDLTTGAITVGNSVNSIIKASTAGGLSLQTSGGSPCLLLGGGGSVNATFYGSTLLNYATANRLVSLNGSKVLTNTDLVSWVAGTSNEIAVTDDGDGSITLSLDPAYAEIYVADASTAQSIPTGATYTKSTAFTTNGLSNNCTADATNDKITITQTGVYRVSGTFSGSSGTANVLFRGAAFLNGVEQNQVHFKHKFSVASDSDEASFSGLIDVTSAPWDLDFRVRHDNAGSVNLTIEYANLNVEYMGAT